MCPNLVQSLAKRTHIACGLHSASAAVKEDQTCTSAGGRFRRLLSRARLAFAPHALIDGKAKHSPTNDWDTNAVWVDARRAVTVTQERHTEPQDKTLSQTDCHTS